MLINRLTELWMIEHRTALILSAQKKYNMYDFQCLCLICFSNLNRKGGEMRC